MGQRKRPQQCIEGTMMSRFIPAALAIHCTEQVIALAVVASAKHSLFAPAT
jgi:hypothetical protein